VAVWAECDQVVESVLRPLCPRDNMVDINIDVPAGVDCTAVAGLEEDLTAQISGNRRAISHN
jgi:hypothetical protein